MKLITQNLHAQLLANGKAALEATRDGRGVDPAPVVKLYTRRGFRTWLLTELSPYGGDCAFGLCDEGHGQPRVGYVYLHDLERPQGKFKDQVELDLDFVATKSLSAYANEAMQRGSIIS